MARLRTFEDVARRPAGNTTPSEEAPTVTIEDLVTKLHGELSAMEDRAIASERALLALTIEMGIVDVTAALDRPLVPSRDEVLAAVERYLDGRWGQVAPQRG